MRQIQRRISITILLLVFLIGICVPAYFGYLAFFVDPAWQEIRHFQLMSGERVSSYEQGVFDQIDQYHTVEFLLTRNDTAYMIPLPVGATPFENAQHPKMQEGAQYMVLSAPYLAWTHDLDDNAPDGFTYEVYGNRLHFESIDRNVIIDIVRDNYGRKYELMKISAWMKAEDGSGSMQPISLT
jgi:hypothetical protein